MVVGGAERTVTRPADVDEVVSAVLAARLDNAEVAVRSGGHCLTAYNSDSDGVVLDLGELDSVQILDRARRLVRIGGGATWGQVAEALAPLGWAISSGDTASVGVGGLTLGGGFGWLLRRQGLTIDSLVSARVVTADGALRTVSSSQHPELFWALRGGGGNFGVVVDFDFVAIPLPSVHFGAITYGLESATELLAGWRDAMRAAPQTLTSSVLLPARRDGEPPLAVVQVCFAGSDITAADAAIEPFLALGSITRAAIEERRYADVLEPGMAMPAGIQLVARNTLVPTLDTATIAATAHFHEVSGANVVVRGLGGRYAEIPSAATAFAHRDAEAMILGMAMLPPDAPPSESSRLRRRWDRVAAHGTGAYLNFQDSAADADVAAAYPPATRARLRDVKLRYDPTNLFARNPRL